MAAVKFICVGKSREGIIVAAYEPTRLGNYHKRMYILYGSCLPPPHAALRKRFVHHPCHAPTPCLRTLSTRTDVMKSSLIKKADSYRVPLKGTDTTVCVAVQLPHVPKPLYHTLSLRLCCVSYCTTQIHMLVDNANHVYVQLCNHHHHHHHHHYHHKHTTH